ncbi:MAG: thioredoxin TrxC [Sandaracinaceae bacterium]
MRPRDGYVCVMVRTCPSCGAQNRVPASKLHLSPRCGRCKTALGPLAEPIVIDSAESYDALLRDARLPVLVDFWATWCPPCRALAPELVELASQRAGSILVAKVDTDALPSVAGRYGIRSIPTVIVFREGREASRVSGAMPAAELARRLAL